MAKPAGRLRDREPTLPDTIKYLGKVNKVNFQVLPDLFCVCSLAGITRSNVFWALWLKTMRSFLLSGSGHTGYTRQGKAERDEMLSIFLSPTLEVCPSSHNAGCNKLS